MSKAGMDRENPFIARSEEALMAQLGGSERGGRAAQRSFLADGWRQNLGWLFIGVLITNGLWGLAALIEADPPRFGLRALSAVMQFLIAWLLAWGLTRRRRPIVEIENGVVRYGAGYPAGIRRTVNLRDVARVRPIGASVELVKKDGDAVLLWLGDLSRESRVAVRSTIEEGLGPSA